MEPVDHIRVTAAIIERNGKILIARRDKEDPLKDKWEFPGGKLEANETPEACLRRELAEELGVVTEIGEFIGASKYEYSHMAIELLVYRAHHVSGAFKANDHAEIRWVFPSELNRYDFPEADAPIVEKLTRDSCHSPGRTARRGGRRAIQPGPNANHKDERKRL